MIQKTQRVATYLYLRNGIYYFQLRLSNKDKRRGRFKSGLIRKSLKTSNYREALNKARLLWVEHMTDNKDVLNANEKIERSAQYDADLYTRGKVLYEKQAQIHPKDINTYEQFFIDMMGKDGVGATQIARDTGVSRASVYRILKVGIN